MIIKTKIGMQIPSKTHRLGVGLQSLNKHIIIPTMVHIMTARVPEPMPPTRPL